MAQLTPQQALTVDRSTDRLFVVNDSGAIVSTRFLSNTTSPGFTGLDVAVTPDGNQAIVSLFEPRRLDFYSLATSPPTLVGTLAMPIAAEDLDIGCTASGFVLVAGGGGNNTVVSVNVATRTVVQTLVLPVGAQAVDTNHDGTLALVVGQVSNSVRVLAVDPSSGLMTDLGMNVARGPANSPYNVTFSPDGQMALVANGNGYVNVLQVTGQSVGLHSSLYLGPNQSIAFTPDGGSCFAYMPSGAGTVAKLQVANGTVTDTGIRLPAYGGGGVFYFGVDMVAVSSTGHLFVRSLQYFTVYDATTNAVLGGPMYLGAGTTGGGITTLCRHNSAPACHADLSQARADFLEPAPGSFVVTEGNTITVPITVSDPDGGNLTVTLTGPAGAALGPVTSGPAPFTTYVTWTPTAGDKAAAPHPITVTVTDPDQASDTCSFAVVDVNLNPVCDAGGDVNGEITVACAGPSGTLLQLSGTASDPDDPTSALAYHWDVSDANVLLSNADVANPTGMFPDGITTATLTVTDGRGGISTQDVTIIVVDTVPPQVECTTDIAVLWPARHAMCTVEVVIRAFDTCTTPAALVVQSVTLSSDEADDAAGSNDGSTTGDVNGSDGHTAPVDITGLLTFDPLLLEYRATVQLRAERNGAGNGRKYTVDVSAVDGANNVGTASCCVIVPHDRRR